MRFLEAIQATIAQRTMAAGAISTEEVSDRPRVGIVTLTDLRFAVQDIWQQVPPDIREVVQYRLWFEGGRVEFEVGVRVDVVTDETLPIAHDALERLVEMEIFEL